MLKLKYPFSFKNSKICFWFEKAVHKLVKPPASKLKKISSVSSLFQNARQSKFGHYFIRIVHLPTLRLENLQQNTINKKLKFLKKHGPSVCLLTTVVRQFYTLDPVKKQKIKNVDKEQNPGVDAWKNWRQQVGQKPKQLKHLTLQHKDTQGI